MSHLEDRVAALRQEFMADSSQGEKYEELIKFEAQLKAYRDSQRRRKQTLAGIGEELNGEIATKSLTRRITIRKAKTTIKEIVYEGKKYEGEREVLTAASEFYSKLFGAKKQEWPMDPAKTLDEERRQRLSAPWTEKEVRQAMKELPRGKAPGADGLPKELLEDNWDLLGESVMAFMQEFEKTAVLPSSASTTVTILLHKKGERSDLGNYRPITLLSAIYKIVAKLLTNRMKKVLPQVISENQFSFIPGRRLADAVKVVADTIDAAVIGKEDWYLLMVDFQKAYDSVSRTFLFRTLERMGFPAAFINWTRGLHEHAATQLLVNGWLGERVNVESGVRQGCPLAPFLFICAAEPLSQEAERRRLGLRKRGKGGLAYLGYADDTTLLLQGKEQLKRAQGLLDDFSVRSGLLVNQGKLTVMPLGKNRLNPPPADTNYSWAARGEPERLLGIWITTDGRAEPTWEKALIRVNAILTNWEKLHLTTTARVMVLNAYVMPVVLFQAQVYQPPKLIWKRILKLCRNFISKGCADEEKHFILWSELLAHLGRREGGLGVISPKERVNSQALWNLGAALLEENPMKQWLQEKASNMPLGWATLLAHKAILAEWTCGSGRWKSLTPLVWDKQLPELPEPENLWEMAQEQLWFSRWIHYQGSSPFGRQKGSECLKGMKVGDLLQEEYGGGWKVKDMWTLTKQTGRSATARWALMAWEAVPEAWKVKLLARISAETIAEASTLVRVGRGVTGNQHYLRVALSDTKELRCESVAVDEEGKIKHLGGTVQEPALLNILTPMVVREGRVLG
ncbi:unnamed protein product [Closterium sp. Yama58-4]|nr:unnamed protein product [Closterium sp. Yama58-4]